MTTPTTLGSILRADRRHARVTQKDLAQAVSCHFTYISRIENDHDSPSAALLIRIADHLGVDPNYYLFLAGKEDPKMLRKMVDHLLEKVILLQNENIFQKILLSLNGIEYPRR